MRVFRRWLQWTPNLARTSPQARRPRIPRIAVWGVVWGLVLGAVLAVPLTQSAFLAVGQPSPVTVEAPTDLTFSSAVKTRAARATAASDPALVTYRTDERLLSEQRTALVTTLERITAIRADPTLMIADRQAAIAELSTLPVSPTRALAITRLSNDAWQRVADESRELFDQVVRQNNNALTELEVDTLRTRTLPYVPQPSDFDGEQRDLLVFFTGAFLRANRIVDQEATDRNRAAAEAGVPLVTQSVVRGQNIVRRGDIVTETTYETLQQLGVVRGVGGWAATAQQFLLGLLVAAAFAAYLGSCQPAVVHNLRALTMLGVVLCVVVLAARVFLPDWSIAPYAFPFAALGVVLAMIFNSELALVATLIFAPVVGLQNTSTVALTITFALTGAAGIFTAARARRTSTFAWSGVAVGVVTMLMALVFWLDMPVTAHWDVQGLTENPLLRIVGFGVLNGIVSAVLPLGVASYLSRAAKVVTPLQLMELGHPNHPLLRRLMREAPGTYHHSMVVSNLAEVAAESIGADPLLARVGAYYHDVGKMLRPFFFTDNQHDRSNVHDQLDAKTSASIIIDHVREGVKLADQYHIPQVIADFIPQHHGTNVVSYFYRRALQEDETVDVSAFQYPGPKPQTREAAIMMLADGVEASVRALSQAGRLVVARADDEPRGRSGQTIAEAVEQIVAERTQAGQLDESPLTLRDIAAIKASFIRTLQGIYHPRVDYTHQRAREG